MHVYFYRKGLINVSVIFITPPWAAPDVFHDPYPLLDAHDIFHPSSIRHAHIRCFFYHAYPNIAIYIWAKFPDSCHSEQIC